MAPMATTMVAMATQPAVNSGYTGANATSSVGPASAASTAPAPAFRLQTKSAVALVNERRIEFVRARNAKALAAIDEATGKLMDSRNGSGSTAQPHSKKQHQKSEHIVAPDVIERLLPWKNSRKIGPGLVNMGNTCYLNSVLQCLAYTPSLAQYLLSKEALATYGVSTSSSSSSSLAFSGKAYGHKHQHQQQQQKPTQGMGFCAVRVLARLLMGVHGNRTSSNGKHARVLQPKDLVMNIRHVSKAFRIGRQEDSHEFFRLLLDAMQRSSLRKAHVKQERDPLARTTFLHRIFGGTLKNSLRCAKCGYVSEREDDFLDLSLEINNGISSVQGALQHFTTTERLDASNAWTCTKCQQPSRAEKGMTIEVCPNVLVLQLKRFDGIFGGKIKKHIAFDTALDLSMGMQKTSPDRHRGRNRYELHAVLVHAGFSTNCGHYYAFVKGSSGQWYEMNDECVRWVSLDTVLQQRAYMLFYSRVLPPSEQPPPLVVVKETPPSSAVSSKARTKEEVKDGAPRKSNGVSPVGSGSKPELSMNGFLESLKTTLTTPNGTDLAEKEGTADAQVEEKGERVLQRGVSKPLATKTTVVTYNVTLPVGKKRKTLKRRLCPAFVGSMGKLTRFGAGTWRPSIPLCLVTEETSEGAPSVRGDDPSSSSSNSSSSSSRSSVATQAPPVATPAPVKRAPKVVVEKVGVNPRELRNFGEHNSALYGKSVSQWADPSPSIEAAVSNGGHEDAAVDAALMAQHQRVLQKMKAEDWDYRNAQRKSSWDEQLDYGKTKKVKTRTAFVANEGATNAFQAALLRKKQKK